MQGYRIRLAATFSITLAYLGCKPIAGKGHAPDGAILIRQRPSTGDPEAHHSIKAGGTIKWWGHGQFYISFGKGTDDPCSNPDESNATIDVYKATQASGNEYSVTCNVSSNPAPVPGKAYPYHFDTLDPTSAPVIGPFIIVPCYGCYVEIDNDQ